MLVQLRTWWRQQRLAADSRAGRYARGNARRKQYDYLRRNWLPHLGVTIVAVAVIVVCSMAVPGEYLRGLAVGAGCTAMVAVQWTWIVQATGTAGLAMGEQAEQWTAASLRKRDGWRLVNHVNLRQSDIDHVLVGPTGVYAVETKWAAAAITPEWLATARRQAARNAKDLSLWSPTRPYGPAQPVVVVWGPSTKDLPPITHDMAVPVVVGYHLDTWWDAQRSPSPHLSAADVNAVWEVLAQRCQTTDPLQPDVPPSPTDIALWGFAITMTGVIAFLATVSLPVGLPTGWAFAAATGSLLVAAAIRLRLTSPARYLATAWATGTGAGLALIALVTVTGISTG